ncbi:calcium-binding protein [Euryhalocaulis caribicus]|uniref:calcium-binding protein n=1 Tax=Euryhalocaulis caribicus TaxID=1161401 RepID=UPI0003A2BB5B|nr:hypothetical protein [Euryhalocaulis caribicus]
MAHLNPDFDELRAEIDGADQVFTVDLQSLNNSSVTGNVFVTVTGDELTVTVVAEGTAKGQVHPQHIHGLFDSEGNPIDSEAPNSFNDNDGDGFVEVLEGVAAYGDVLLPLVAPAGDVPDGRPVSDASGDLFFSYTYDLSDDSQFFSPVTGNDYTGEDLIELFLREYVLHGSVIPEGYGEGTEGEVSGDGGYIGILPAAAGGLEETSKDAALALFDSLEDDFRNVISGDDTDESLTGVLGDDAIFAGGGDDRVAGRDGNDSITGGDGNDRLLGGDGDDFILGGAGADRAFGGNGDDTYVVQGSSDDYRVIQRDDGQVIVQEAGTDNRDVLFGFESIEFYNEIIAVDNLGSDAMASTTQAAEVAQVAAASDAPALPDMQDAMNTDVSGDVWMQ